MEQVKQQPAPRPAVAANTSHTALQTNPPQTPKPQQMKPAVENTYTTEQAVIRAPQPVPLPYKPQPAPVPAAIPVQQQIAAMPRMGVKMPLGIFTDTQTFRNAVEMAKILCRANILPKDFSGNEANTLILIDLAMRLGISIMEISTCVTLVNGKPGWEAKYIIGKINTSPRYASKVEYEYSGNPEDDTYGCRAVCVTSNGQTQKGPIVTIKMAKDEGWYEKTTKDGKPIKTKWQTMPEMMLSYRAVSFFARLYCPELLLGLSMDCDNVEPEIDVL